jgi:hypothetical protein
VRGEKSQVGGNDTMGNRRLPRLAKEALTFSLSFEGGRLGAHAEPVR